MLSRTRDARRKQGMIESELVDEKALMTGAAQVVGKARIAPLREGDTGQLLCGLHSLDEQCHPIECELGDEIGAERHDDMIRKVERRKCGK